MLKKLIFLVTVFVAIFIISPNHSYTYAKNTHSNKEIEAADKSKNISNIIDKYQEKYFVIIKRNNVFLSIEDDKELDKDRKELKSLYKEVEKQIKNKQYLKEYRNIKKRYSKCKEETTIGINEFAQNNYNDIDALLNKRS